MPGEILTPCYTWSLTPFSGAGAILHPMKRNIFLVWGAVLAAGSLAACTRMHRDQLSEAMLPVPTAAAATLAIDAEQAAEQTRTGTGHEARRSADGLFYVDAQVNGRTVRFLVDTGASVMVLTARDARIAGIALQDHHYSQAVETVGGSTPMAWTTLEQVDVAGHQVRGIRAGVVRNGLGVSLLGQNLLTRLNSVTISADRISLR